jgi:hypothetical protein
VDERVSASFDKETDCEYSYFLYFLGDVGVQKQKKGMKKFIKVCKNNIICLSCFWEASSSMVYIIYCFNFNLHLIN